MELHNLKPAKGSVKKGKRIARGQGGGTGRTATRGHKGQQSRSGWSRKRNFEGGQMPLQMRLPKRGFNNINRIAYLPFNLSRLQEIVDKYKLSSFSVEKLYKLGIVQKNDKIKVLGNGELNSKIEVTVHASSVKAKEAIEARGGKLNII